MWRVQTGSLIDTFSSHFQRRTQIISTKVAHLRDNVADQA